MISLYLRNVDHMGVGPADRIQWGMSCITTPSDPMGMPGPVIKRDSQADSCEIRRPVSAGPRWHLPIHQEGLHFTPYP